MQMVNGTYTYASLVADTTRMSLKTPMDWG